ncbi:MAG: AI-2E family transporter, partial [Balneolales bacterium]
MPFFEKANRILFFLIAAFLLLYYLDGFLIPLTFGIFFAMLILPFTLFLERYKLSAALSAIISTLLLFILVGGLTFLFISQIMQFAEQLPDLQDEVQAAIERLQQQIASATGILPDEQQDIAEDRMQGIWEFIEGQAANFIGGLLGFSFSFLLVFIYTFLLQLYREKFARYAISSYTTAEEKENARHAINQISKVVYQYLWGRIQLMTALADLVRRARSEGL